MSPPPCNRKPINFLLCRGNCKNQAVYHCDACKRSWCEACGESHPEPGVFKKPQLRSKRQLKKQRKRDRMGRTREH